MFKVLCVCGARPNFMKVAPLVEALGATPGAEAFLVHTGQHYDAAMSDVFFGDLQLRPPDVNLDVGRGSQAQQTAEIMKRFEPVCLEYRPDCVVVVGDVNSTVTCALVAAKLGVAIAHVEAGLRSFDRTMPEEINRVVTDALSDVLFVTEPSGVVNLRREGVAEDRIHLVGNVMIDTLLRCKARAAQSRICEALELQARNYAVVTIHRPRNVDRREAFSAILDALEAVGEEFPVIFPVHPRARTKLQELGLEPRAKRISNLRLLGPLGYLDFLKLMSDAAVVLTDSGGIQEETAILAVPCLTLRDNTERPITVTHGTNQLTGSSTESIVRAFRKLREQPPRPGKIPHLWDGRAAERIVGILRQPGVGVAP